MAKYTLVRHYCSNCSSRIFPFDKFENTTEYPEEHERPLLLKSHNSAHKGERIAWCWNCAEWVKCERKTEHEIIALYIGRKGVIYRGGTPRWAKGISAGKARAS